MSPVAYQYIMGQLPILIEQSKMQHQYNKFYHTDDYTQSVKLLPLPSPILMNCRIGDPSSWPIVLPSLEGQAWLQQRLQDLYFFNSKTSPTGRKYLLSQKELSYFKSFTKPNATLFIHGYNVPLGHFSDQIFSLEGSNTAGQVLYQPQTKFPIASQNHIGHYFLDHQAATVWRDKHAVHEQFGILSQGSDQLNGEGAHQWFLQIEHHLNQVMGFQGFQYQANQQSSYTRMIHIAWQGNPASAMDYMAVQPIAELTAISLLPLLMQLIDARIKVNLIAHSAGCIVALKAMQFLAHWPQYQSALDHVFLWQAALPQTALSPQANQLDQSVDNFWQTQDAHRSAKKIIVLHSRHDGILGPDPAKYLPFDPIDVMVKSKQSDDPSNANIERIKQLAQTAFSLGHVHNAIESIYHVAQLLAIPLSALMFDGALQRQVYDKWFMNPSIWRAGSKPAHDFRQQTNQCFEKHSRWMRLFCWLIQNYLIGTLHQIITVLYCHEYLVGITRANLHQQLMLYQQHCEQFTQGHYFLDRHQVNYQWIKSEKSYLPQQLLPRALEFLNFAKLNKTRLTSEFLRTHEHLALVKPGKEPLQWLGRTAYLTLVTDIDRQNRDHIALVEGLATLVLTAFCDLAVTPVAALGYAGPDQQDSTIKRLKKRGKLHVIDQTDWLYHHSGLKRYDLFARSMQAARKQVPDYLFGGY